MTTMKFKNKKFIYRRYFKRLFDIILSILSVIFLSPVLLLVAILVRVKLGTPILFQQKRPGLNGEIFTIYKFRTMTSEQDENGVLLVDSHRLTKFGRMLRSTSLDELPELFNIIKGDMSIVGPRPLLVQYLKLYDKHQQRRHEVRPGLTGYAQVNGRNAISWETKFNMDVEYVDNISFMGDLKIILKTIKKVFFKEDISSGSSMTMEPFNGSKASDDTQSYLRGRINHEE
jgi:undecaprenyl phosphate N,N'-diacetylbacillosamine 1-phosphate transferase